MMANSRANAPKDVTRSLSISGFRNVANEPKNIKLSRLQIKKGTWQPSRLRSSIGACPKPSADVLVGVHFFPLVRRPFFLLIEEF